ncbi:hypothetical protein KR009_011157, partial [Drosophila setifemur]
IMPVRLNGKKLIEKLRWMNEPVTFESLVESFSLKGKSSEDLQRIKGKLRNLLNAAVRLGFVKEYNDHYFTSSHVDEVAELIESEMESEDELSSEDDES